MMHFLIVAALLGTSPFIVPPPTTSASYVTVPSTPTTCSGDTLALTVDGVTGSTPTTDIAPNGTTVRPQSVNPGAVTNTTASNLMLAGGADTKTFTVATAASCGTDTMTVTVVSANGAAANCTCVEATGWTKTDGNNNATATSLASCVNSCTGVSATASSATVLVQLDCGTSSISLATSDAACATIVNGTQGNVIVAPRICFQNEAGTTGPCIEYATSTNLQLTNTAGSAAASQFQQVGGNIWASNNSIATYFSNAGGLGMGNTSKIAWSSGVSGHTSLDVGIERGGAGLLKLTNGSTGDASGIKMGQLAHASLGTPGNGHVVYCSDCTIANPCASGGTGALAKRLNGAWVCN